MPDPNDVAISVVRDAMSAKSGIPSYIIQVTDEKTDVVTNHFDYSKYSDFLSNHFHTVYFNKTIFIYDYGSHLYREQTNEIETHIRNTFIEYKISGKLISHLAELRSHITSMGSYTDYPFNGDTKTIPVDNGIVKINYDIEEVTLLPHGPEHMFTYKLSVVFDPSIKNCAAIPLLKRMVEPECVKTLIQIPAQALLQMQTGHAYKKAYLLQGEPHAGKTSYLKLLYMMFGDNFTTSISLQQLCTDRFVGGNLEGKLLNIYDDLEDVALEVIDQFKTLTGDCRHGIERKYALKYTGKVTSVHIFTCNYPPEYPEKVKRDTAFWTRWEYIKFPFAYAVNPNFYTEWYTQATLSSFFNLILSMMIYIKKHGLASNSDIQEVMMNWSVNSDPLYEFIEKVFQPGDGKTSLHYSKKKLFDAYRAWCFDNQIAEHRQKLTLKAFTVALQAHNFTPYRLREAGNNYEVFATCSHVKRPDATIDINYVTTLSL